MTAPVALAGAITGPVGPLPPVGVPPVAPPVQGPAVGALLTPAATPKAAPATRAAAGTPMSGVFQVTSGACAGATPTGSYFQMIQPGGTRNGPFVGNGDSPCKNTVFTPLFPGTDGGLDTTRYQPQPNPVFSGGNSLAGRIVHPQKFFGADFGAATNPTDPQSSVKVPLVTITDDGAGHLGGDVRAYAASWNGQHFNQGAPKPDGSKPGITKTPSGTYSAATGHYTLEWLSTIVGGPFNNFTGVWHLEGTFVPAAGAAPATTVSPATAPAAPTPAASSASTSASTPDASASAAAPTTTPVTGLPYPLWLGPAMLLVGLAGRLVLRRTAPRGATP